MNSKLLYTYFRHERKHNVTDKLEKNSHEKGSNKLLYKQNMNPCVKCRPQLCNFIKILLKEYTTKLHRFQHFLLLQEVYLEHFGLPKPTFRNQNLLQLKNIF